MPTEHELKNLLEKYASGTTSPEETRLLEAWFSRIGDDRQAGELNDADRQRMLNAFKQNARFNKSRSTKVISLWPAWKKWAVAASVIGVMMLSGLWVNNQLGNNQEQDRFVTIHTDKGEVRKIVLPDNSVVWLNARTQLSYVHNFKEHRFLRLNGEAVFTAIHDKAHPFIVQTPDGIETTDLGTEFNIRSYAKSAETEVTVLTGSVSVGKVKEPAQNILYKNDVVNFNRATRAFVKTHDNAESSAAWRTGQWELKGRGLDALAILLYNQYGINLQHTEKSLDALELNANFNNKQTPEEIISTFCLLANCKYRWKSATSVELY